MSVDTLKLTVLATLNLSWNSSECLTPHFEQQVDGAEPELCALISPPFDVKRSQKWGGE